jgi:hypothetical protein
MSYRVVRAYTLADLERLVREAQDQEGLQPVGAPFKDLSTQEWGQAVSAHRPAARPGEVNLKEPKRK